VLGEVGKLPDIFTELEINFFLLRRLLGVKAEGDKQATKVQKLVKSEVLMVNIGSTSTGGRVLAVKADLAKIVLISPVCTQEGEKIALSRRVEKHWRYVLSIVLTRSAQHSFYSTPLLTHARVLNNRLQYVSGLLGGVQLQEEVPYPHQVHRNINSKKKN